VIRTKLNPLRIVASQAPTNPKGSQPIYTKLSPDDPAKNDWFLNHKTNKYLLGDKIFLMILSKE
jgi:hypothetical protein